MVRRGALSYATPPLSTNRPTSRSVQHSHVRIDSYLDEAIVTLDDANREGMLKEIGNQYMTDVALIPLHWQVNVWAMRADLDMPPRLMEVTHAMRIKSRK